LPEVVIAEVHVARFALPNHRPSSVADYPATSGEICPVTL
jgi:hypothetical protein